jgi:hypothetical protein
MTPMHGPTTNANGSGPPPPAPRVFLGMPGYGEHTGGAGRGFWRATRLPDTQVVRVQREGSLLAANFNALWVDALNLMASGRTPKYFAMQHSDIEPEDWWLDTLIAELEARDLDILGVAVPIKDHHGLTSLALAHPSGDDFRILCRLTMQEVFRLPETFTSADIGHPLLLNTGLWVCRFSPSWVDQVHFTINDRIVITPDGRYRAQCEPEDWYFSRLCHELGLKVGATRKIRLNHRGCATFPNTSAWGEPFDSAWTDHSVVPEAPADRFTLPDIDGWLRPEEGEALAKLAEGKRVLEVGSYCGLSTVCLARTAKLVVAVDPHDGRGTAVPQDTLPKLRANLQRYGVADRVTVYPVPFARLDPDYTCRFDLIFIDGAHDAESVRADIRRALPLLAPGGVLAFHDYGSPIDPGVAEAVDELIGEGAEMLSIHASLAVVRPPAVVPDPQLLEV